MRLLPEGFATGLKKVTGEFLQGVWHGMGPGPKRGIGRVSKGCQRGRKSHR